MDYIYMVVAAVCLPFANFKIQLWKKHTVWKDKFVWRIDRYLFSQQHPMLSEQQHCFNK
jgi:hypothetical protein